MEKPYIGRATIHDFITELQIVIPAKRNWFVIIFLCAWLGGWLLEVFALTTVARAFAGHPANLFIFFWLIAWTVAGFFVIRTVLWNLGGKEIITAGQNLLTIGKKGALFNKPKVYDLNEVKNMRVQDDVYDRDWYMSGTRNNFGSFQSSGMIRFDYGLKTVKFASGIDEAEARYIIERLKERRLIGEKNLG